MQAFVLDASMALSWHFASEETPTTAAVERLTLDTTVIVPGHWHGEVANTLFVGERSKRTTPENTARFLDRLRDIEIIIDDLGGRDLIEAVLPISRAHKLTVYDALYLELAERRGLPLASLDGALVAAARGVGVTIVTDGL